ncbi:MAG: type II toxin-antitoxin system VapB family antitoxin [Candidatus Omnitrophica bacterium]|nr:type II toxin-antitoxin system VapB family antitoxin [Candidatus Omnitrophota bacterium]
MRTTVDIPEGLIGEAIRLSHAKTKTMVIVLGLKELINRHKLEQLRALRGVLPLVVDVPKARGRRGR